MNTKPILFWPKPRSDIETHLDRAERDFSVVDTNSIYELQKLYKMKRTTPIFDPFPGRGDHYRDFSDHVVASECSLHIVGLEACRKVLKTLEDPSLAHSSIDELVAAMTPPGSGTAAANRFARFARSPVVKRSVDWSYLNWPNAVLSAILVFLATLIGNTLFPADSLTAATVAMFVFVALYVCVRISAPKLFSSSVKRGKRLLRNQPAASGLKHS
jgi:hypothetical protein